MKRADVISVVEASYGIRAPDEAWLRGILEAARPSVDLGRGMLGYVYDLRSRPGRLIAFVGLDSPFGAAETALSMATASEAYIDQSWRMARVAAASEVPGYEEQPAVRLVFHPRGLADVLAINAYDPSGVGVWIGAPSPKRVLLASRQRLEFGRLSSHLASAFRLRQHVASIEALLSPAGKVMHAEGRAKQLGARATLIAASKAIERARGKLRRDDPETALGSWRALVSARWSVVDHFDSDGKRYLVARTNDPLARGPETLTERERQLLEYASLGRTNKEIAYELGVAASTVRVLLARAGKKLGAKSRAELVRAYEANRLAKTPS